MTIDPAKMNPAEFFLSILLAPSLLIYFGMLSLCWTFWTVDPDFWTPTLTRWWVSHTAFNLIGLVAYRLLGLNKNPKGE